VAYPAAAIVPPDQPPLDRPDWLAAEALERSRDQLAQAASAYGRIVDAAADPTLAARASQGEIRCLVRSGERELAIQQIRKRFAAAPAARGLDRAGRSIAADERLLVLDLLKPGDARRPAAAQQLAALLNDYTGVAMPSAQRLFLMDQLAARLPGPECPALPTHVAERLAAQFVAAEGASPGDRRLQPTRLPGVWKFASADGRVIALYRTETIAAAMRGVLDPVAAPRSVRFSMLPPGQADRGETIAAGPALPGWRISVSLSDTRPFDEAARSRTVSYLWTGLLAIAAIAATGILVGQALRRQWRLARLRTDLARRRQTGPGKDPRVSRLDLRREPAPHPPDPELPDVLAHRTPPPAVSVRRDEAGGRDPQRPASHARTAATAGVSPGGGHSASPSAARWRRG
jgi:hypothetical protein